MIKDELEPKTEDDIDIKKDSTILYTQSKSTITMHKDVALQKLNTLLNKYIDNPNTIDKADKLSYWIEDYSRLLDFEDDFKPCFLKTYSRGDILKVNFGYNIGNEEGGLHYCVVVEKNNSVKSGIITVIPLTSDKGKKVHFSEVNIGNEIYCLFKEKYKKLTLELSKKINGITLNKSSHDDVIQALLQLNLIKKIDEEMSKMKQGSIALVSQITTISKQRIYDPQKVGDILSGIHISDNSLDLINNKMKQLFIKN